MSGPEDLSVAEILALLGAGIAFVILGVQILHLFVG